jgi:predicted DNA binding protein
MQTIALEIVKAESMRILKIKIPSKALLDLGLPNHFEVIKHLEVLQIFQYDRNNFFAMYKIVLKNEKMEGLETYLQDLFQAQTFQVLEKKADEILCIIKQRNKSGFWPKLLTGSWALMPPLILDPDAVVFSVIIKDDDHLYAIMNQLKMFESMQLLAVANMDEMAANSMSTMPRLTNRQKEVMTYATRKGYFKMPKQISTERVAEHFQISASAILNHVQKAEKTIMEYLFG